MLSEAIPSCESEELLSSALAANDELSKALTTYEELASGLGSGAQRAASGAGGEGSRWRASQHSSDAGGPALPMSSSAGGGGIAANFSLLDEGEDEDAPELTTNRVAAPGRAGAGAGGVPAGAGAPQQLIDLEDIDLREGAGGPRAGGGPGGLDEGVARLGLGSSGGKAPQT